MEVKTYGQTCIKNITRAKVYITVGSFKVTLVKQAVYRNYHTVRGVTVLILKVQELQLSYRWNRMLYLEMMLCINIKSNQQVQWLKGRF